MSTKTSRRFEFADFDIDDETLVIEQQKLDDPAPASAAEAPEPEPEPAEPAITEADLEQARREGYESGLSDGREAAERELTESRETRMLAVLHHAGGLLETLLASEDRRLAAAEADAAAIAESVARKILPAYAEREGLNEITALAQKAIADRLEEQRIAIRTNDLLLDRLRERVEPMARDHGFEGRLIFLADNALGPEDCLIEWADGGIERRAETQWSEVGSAVAEAAPPASAVVVDDEAEKKPTQPVNPADAYQAPGTTPPTETTETTETSPLNQDL